jgi:hypothetical protein
LYTLQKYTTGTEPIFIKPALDRQLEVQSVRTENQEYPTDGLVADRQTARRTDKSHIQRFFLLGKE